MATAAPAAKQLLAEATALFPNRSTGSDGILSSVAHRIQNPVSGHDTGNAADLTHDPANGCDAHALAERVMLRRDPRVLYVISRRRIWSQARYGERWRPYTGLNPHETHAHFEIDPNRRNDISPWFANNPTSAAVPAAHRFAFLAEEDDAMIPHNTVVCTLACTMPNCPGGWWELRADGTIETTGSDHHRAHHYFGSIHEQWMDAHRPANGRFTAIGPRRGAPGYTTWGHNGTSAFFYEFGPGVGPVPVNVP